MKKSILTVVVFALALALSWGPLPSARAAEDKRLSEDEVVKFVGMTKEMVHYQVYGGQRWVVDKYGNSTPQDIYNKETKEFLKVGVAHPETGAGTIIYIDLKEEKWLKDLKPGDYLKVGVFDDGTYHRPVAREVVQYKPKPGENQPNTYFFVSSAMEKVKGTELLAVTGLRFAVKSVFYAPTAHDKDNKVIPEPKLAKLIGGLKPDDRIEITIDKSVGLPMIKTLLKAPPPVTGAFVELRKKTVGNQEYDVVVIKTDKDEVSYLVPLEMSGGKQVSDPDVMMPASHCIKDANVQVKLFEEDGNLFVRAIENVKK